MYQLVFSVVVINFWKPQIIPTTAKHIQQVHTLKGELALIICYPRSSENGLSLLVNFAFLMVLTLLAVCRFHSKDGISPSLLWLALESFLLSLSAVTISSAVSISSSIMSLMLHSYQQNLFQSQKKLATHTHTDHIFTLVSWFYEFWNK